MLSRRKYLITTGSAVSIMAIAGCSTPTDSENNEEDTQDGSSTEETDEETNPENQVQIVEHELVEDPERIIGVVENNSEEEVGPVTVDITLIDENGEEFEPSTVTGNTEFGIEPNSRWEFEAAMAYDGEFEEYNLSLVFAN